MVANISNIHVGYLWIALVVVFFVTVFVCSVAECIRVHREDVQQEALKVQRAAEWQARKDKWAAEKAIQVKLNAEAAERRYQQGLKDDRVLIERMIRREAAAPTVVHTPFPPTTPVRDTWPKPYPHAVKDRVTATEVRHYREQLDEPIGSTDASTMLMVMAAQELMQRLDEPAPYAAACATQEVQSYSPPMYDSSVSDSCTSSDTSSSYSDSSSSDSSSCSSSD